MATKKKARRQYGSGSITKRKDGRWQGSFASGTTAKGSPKRTYVYGHSEAEVKTKLKLREREHNANGPAAENVSIRTTVASWSATWLEIRERKVRPKSFATDASAIRKWIIPAIGHRRLTDLTPADIRAVEKVQRDAGRSTSTMNRTQSTLTALLRAAIQEGHSIQRRVLESERPALAVHDRTNMQVSEALAALYVASQLPHGSRWALSFLHGWRQAECLGLTWPCVNLEAGFATAEWQLQQLPYVDAKDKARGFRVPDGYDCRQLEGAYHLTRPKTKKGFRVTRLEPAMIEAFRYWREIAPESPHDLVWPTATGSPANDKDDREEWYAIQGTAQIGHPNGRYYKVHENRHTTAQGLLEMGADPLDATAFMGHSSILTTRGYQHPSQRTGQHIVERLADTFQIELFNINQRQALSGD